MSLDMFFIIFFFFTHKQVYTSSHFTGASTFVKNIITVISVINSILEIIYLIYKAINDSIVNTILLLIISVAILFLLNKIIARVTINKMRNDGYDINSEYFWGIYNHKCDISSTVLSIIGIIVNIIIIYLFFGIY